MVTDKHYMLPHAYILCDKSYGRVMTYNFKVRQQFYNEMLLYFVLLLKKKTSKTIRKLTATPEILHLSNISQ